VAEKYDDETWHYSGVHSHDAARTHMAFYIVWASFRGLSVDQFFGDTEESRKRLIERRFTPVEYFKYVFEDGKLTSHEFTEGGKAFTSVCYREYLRRYSSFANSQKPGKRELRKSKLREKIGLKPQRRKGSGSDRFYRVEDNWVNYEKVSALLDALFDEWRDWENRGAPETGEE